MDCLFPVVCLADVPPYRIDHLLEEAHEAAGRLVPGIAPCFRVITGRDEKVAETWTPRDQGKSQVAGWSSYLPWPLGSTPKQADPSDFLVNLDAEPSEPPTHPFITPYEGKDIGTTALDLASRCRPINPDLFVVLDEASCHFDTCELVYVNSGMITVETVRASFRNAQVLLEGLRYGTRQMRELQLKADANHGLYGKRREALKKGEKAELRARQPLIDLDDY